jgi:biopolymer transport protein ExbD
MAIAKLPDEDGGADEGAENIFSEINITPLTDVFLVMLIIFMVSALAIVDKEHRQSRKKDEQAEIEKKTGLKINLPAGQAQDIDTSQKSLVLLVPIDGPVNVAGKPYQDNELDNLFRAAYQHEKTTQVVLKADKGVAHGRVVNLMERAKAAGLTKLAIGTSGGS